jgi:pimeloyl-ACP methyl ester carboxylesterase
MAERSLVRFALVLAFVWPVLALSVAAPASADPAMAAFPPPGRLVTVDGYQRHLFCTGAGTPTVMLEEGAGGASLNWVWIQRMVTASTRVCSYDRPGYGWSDPSDTPRDGQTVSRELEALLQSAGEKGPFIVAGHSLGGAYARMFAAAQRDKVVGLVLVDATSPSAIATMDEVGLPPMRKSDLVMFLASHESVFQMADRIGLIQLKVDLDLNDFPADAVPALQAFLMSGERARTSVREQDAVSDTVREISLLGGVGAMPVTVIAADRWVDKDPELAARRAEWDKKHQRDWLAISTNSYFLIVPGSDHLSLLSRKEHAVAVSDAIIRMVRSLRRR